MNVVIFLSLAFGLSEFALVLFKRTKTGIVKARGDKGSLLLLWLIMISCITTGFFKAKYGDWTPINFVLALIGVLVYAIGLIIRWKAILQLKQRFTVDVSINIWHTLETQGLYRHLRHPSYLGLLLIIAGLALAMNSLISFTIVVVPVFSGLIYRIYVEEKLLEREFGEKYLTYKAERKKIIPFIF